MFSDNALLYLAGTKSEWQFRNELYEYLWMDEGENVAKYTTKFSKSSW